MTVDIFRFAILQDMPELVHGIFGRQGGVSPEPYDTLNVGADVADDPANVRRNLEIVCEALDLAPAALVTVRQVHSNRVMRVGKRHRGQKVGELDGLITDEAGVPLILRFADCVPILAYDPRRGVLGAAHAGWRGTIAGMARSLVLAMVDEFGCRPEDIRAGIGPSIGPCCYQVGEDVVQMVHQAFGKAEAGRLFRHVNGRAHFDLWQANRRQLAELGVEQIEVAGVCTACSFHRFFSHRASGGLTGRFPMVAMLR
ncbi:MAG: peptidoglycan editing factor PgeF [Anaerolineae bacterium]